MHFDDRYALGTDLCIPVKCVHNVDSGTYAMSLWAPVKDYDGVNIIRWDEDQPIGPSYLLGEISLMRFNGPGIQQCWKFTGVTNPYVIIDEALVFYIGGSTAPEEIECYFSVYHNGVYQEYIDYTSLTFSTHTRRHITWTVHRRSGRRYFPFFGSTAKAIPSSSNI